MNLTSPISFRPSLNGEYHEKIVPCALARICALALAAAGAAHATDYYVDPVSGNINNPGTSNLPWNTLQAVFSANKPFAAGDVIYLRNGYHGAPVIKGVNSGTVYIRAQGGHAPTARSLDVLNAARWTISDLALSPFYAGATMTNADVICRVRSTASHVTIQNCEINSVADTVDVKQWTVADWAKAAMGVQLAGPNCQAIGNTVKNVRFGIRVESTAPGALVTGNLVENFSADGMDGVADNCEFSYNTVMNSYLDEPNDGDTNHDDGFQSWVTSPATQVSNVVLRGNVFINFTDAAQPHKGDMQGIGCFDGWFNGWVVENNLVVVDMINAIAFLGAQNCAIVNNTAVENPLNAAGYVPGIRVQPHKNGTASSGNTIRNNFAATTYLTGAYTADHNITTTAYATHFANYASLDFHLKAGSAAIDAGVSTLAPSIDADQLARSAPYDVGCYEHHPANTHGGVWSLKSAMTAAPSYSNVSQSPTGIAANTSYVASLWIRGSGSVRITVRAGSWGATLATLQCNATSGWTQVATPAFDTGSNTQLTFVLQDQYGTAGTVYIDDVFLGVSGGANKLANPGFESGAAAWTVGNPSIWGIGQF